MLATECLGAEHVVFLRQLEHLENLINGNGSNAAISATVATIETAVDAHAQTEESGIYPALEPTLGRSMGPLAVMDAEHADIRKTLTFIKGTNDKTPKKELADAAKHFINVLREHITKEDNILFPMAVQILGVSKLDAMAKQCQSGHSNVAPCCHPLEG